MTLLISKELDAIIGGGGSVQNMVDYMLAENISNFSSSNGYSSSSNGYSSSGDFSFGTGSSPIDLDTVNVYGTSSNTSSMGFNMDLQQIQQFTTFGEMGGYVANSAKAVEAFSALNKAAVGFGIAVDTKSLLDYYNNHEGNMDGARFTIRTVGGVASIIIATSELGGFAGPPGVVYGFAVGVATAGAEIAYDQTSFTLQELWGQ